METHAEAYLHRQEATPTTMEYNHRQLERVVATDRHLASHEINSAVGAANRNAEAIRSENQELALFRAQLAQVQQD